MKKKFYPSIAFGNRLLFLLFAALLVCGTTTQAQTYTITFPNAPPATNDASVNQNDGNGFGIEFGVRFRVTQIGTVTAIRFYKGDLVTGVHTGNLWDNSGTLLASATFTETANGWQEVAFATPVAVAPGNNYVASVFNTDGDYGSENDTWAGGVDLGTNPIKVIAWLNDPGRNGIFAYTNVSVFPTSDGTADNYWVDLRFAPTFPLPVNLYDFKATTASKDISLNWKTSSENNNRGFEVERSNNGTDWYDIGFVNGAGESTIVRNYGYTDKGLAPGLYYYRLNQVDFDGKSKLSQVVTATVSGKGQVSLFSPNPFSGGDLIRFDLPRAQKVRLSIFDMTGREIKVLADNSREAGSHLITLNTVGLGRQLYYIRLRSEDGIVTKTILVE